MSTAPPRETLWDRIALQCLRLAASGWVPASWFLKALPPESERKAVTGRLRLEIVSHCWGYAHMQAYQLSSLVLHPPTKADVTMTVYYSPEDRDTVALLEYFGAMEVPGVTWNWQPLDKYRLFRRAIGRDHAARNSGADWVWFTDCDVVFGAGCLDGLAAALQGRRDALVFPRVEHVSAPLEPGDPVLEAGKDAPRVLALDTAGYSPLQRGRATGPLQIAHGDVARAVGYCGQLKTYQKPVARWAKAHEDRAFRWLLRTQGVAVEVPGVYRIRHVSKGRYQQDSWTARLRTSIRRLQLRLREGPKQ